MLLFTSVLWLQKMLTFGEPGDGYQGTPSVLFVQLLSLKLFPNEKLNKEVMASFLPTKSQTKHSTLLSKDSLYLLADSCCVPSTLSSLAAQPSDRTCSRPILASSTSTQIRFISLEHLLTYHLVLRNKRAA